MNMKNILRLMGALALTTGATTSVVACGDTPTPNIHMNAAVSKLLGLTTDNDGKIGTQVASLIANGSTDFKWTINALTTAITADKLLTTDNKAANQEAYDFITGTLKIKLKSGTSFKDGVFDKSELAAIKGEITNIKPTFNKLDNNKDYAITGGTFNFQFEKTKDGTTKLGDNYTINLKTDATVGVIATTLGTIIDSLVATDTDVKTAIAFEKGQTIPKGVDGTKIKITGTTDAAKQFTALNKLTNLAITVKVNSHTHSSSDDTWTTGDKVTLSYQTTAVTFDKTSEFSIQA